MATLTSHSHRLIATGARYSLLLLTLLMLGSCGSTPESTIKAVLEGTPERIAREVIGTELKKQGLPPDLINVAELVATITRLLQEKWGEREPEVASEHRYVKYSNAYEARAIVDFDQGWLQVETIATQDPLGKLREAIINTLLTTRDMRVEDIFTDATPDTSGEPFLLKQVLDADGEPIRWHWRAARFADYLIEHQLQQEHRHDRLIHRIRVPLVDNHLHLRELQYAELVMASSRQYGVSPTLIYAVIEVESAFNPYAVSPANAYGLMQVVPATAGRDVFERIKKQGGEPTRQQLFKPGFNIDIGSAYLHILDAIYLTRIKHPLSRHYASIAAYNGGAGGTLRTFSRDKTTAVARINTLSPEQVYQRLTTEHPFAETRNYLKKVRRAEAHYQ